MINDIWVFCGANGQFPSGVFSDLAVAEAWIAQYFLSGVLTKYPVNEGVFDWAVKRNFFRPSAPHHQTPDFIGKFTSAVMDHYHFEGGQRADS